MKTNKVSLKKEILDLKKIIFLQCLNCVCYQPKEIPLCEIHDCPLWKKRPIKTKGLYTLIKRLGQKNISSSEANK